MAVIDTLEILIEADASGLETQLKKGITTVTSFIDKLNSEEVNWQKVLAGSLDTAIISGIASSFAIAIAQAVSFQDSLLNVSNNAGAAASNTGSSIGGLSDSIASLAGSTGASLTDTAAAYEALYKQFGNVATAQELTTEIGQLALASNQDLADLMPRVIDLFNQWGVTTLPGAQDALTGLVNAAGEGKFSMDELIGIISKQGPILQGTTNITEMALQLQQLSDKTNLSKGSIVDAFGAISQAVANPLSTMNLLVGNMQQKMNGPDGLVKAFSSLAGYIQGAGAAGVTFGQQMGLSAADTKNLGDQSTAAFKAATDGADFARAHMLPFQTLIQQNLSIMDHFKMEFSEFLALLTKDVGFPVLDTITNALEEINHLWSDLDSKGAVGFLKSLGSDVGSALQQGMSKFLGPAMNAVQNKMGGNSQQSGMGPVTLNTTVNIAASTTGSNPQAVGNGIGTSLYDSFTGLLSKLGKLI